MSLEINTKVNALDISKNLVNTARQISDSMQRLSTGTRIDSAKDTVGFSMTNVFQAKVLSMKVEYQDIQEKNSALQTADAGISKVNDILVRMKDLATQAASGNSDNSKSQLSKEFDELKTQITKIVDSTTYSGKKILNGNFDIAKAEFKPEAQENSSSTVNNDANTFDISLKNLGVDKLNITDANGAEDAMDNIDKALTKLNGYSSAIGAGQNRMQYQMDNLAVKIENYSASENDIKSADMASELMNYTKAQILQQSSIAMLSQANSAPQQILQLLRG